MLPITRHRTLAIPHRLALAAAAVCLVLSFTVDHAALEESLQDQQTAARHVEEHPDAPATSVSPSERTSAGGTSSRKSKLQLLPWFAGLAR